MPNIITFGTADTMTADPGIWQYDFGQTLEIHGLTGLTPAVQVHFAITRVGTAEVRIGTYADGVLTVVIPDSILSASQDWFYAYVYVNNDTSGQTIKSAQVRLHQRPQPTDTVTPEQQTAYDEMVTELNGLIVTVGQTNNEAAGSAEEAAQSEENAKTSETTASQALTDLLAMLGIDICPLVGGVVPPDKISLLTQHNFETITDEAQLTSLALQNGDLAHLIEGEGDAKRISKTFKLIGDDAAIRSNWAEVATGYSSESGYSILSGTAENANMINNHRLVESTTEAFPTLIKDPETYYIVG